MFIYRGKQFRAGITVLMTASSFIIHHISRTVLYEIKYHIESSLASVRLWRRCIALWSGSWATSVVAVYLDHWVSILLVNVTDEDCTVFGYSRNLLPSVFLSSLFVTGNVGWLPPLIPCKQHASKVYVLLLLYHLMSQHRCLLIEGPFYSNLIKISHFISLSVCFCRLWKDLTQPRSRHVQVT